MTKPQSSKVWHLGGDISHAQKTNGGHDNASVFQMVKVTTPSAFRGQYQSVAPGLTQHRSSRVLCFNFFSSLFPSSSTSSSAASLLRPLYSCILQTQLNILLNTFKRDAFFFWHSYSVSWKKLRFARRRAVGFSQLFIDKEGQNILPVYCTYVSTKRGDKGEEVIKKKC